MFARRIGRTVPLSTSRRLILDVMHASRKVPVVVMERRMDLSPLVTARRTARVRIGWCTLFLKAFAVLASRHAPLRRAYLSFPRPHFYEHPISVAAVTVEREFEGEPCVFIGHIAQPETMTLPALDAALTYFKEHPVWAVDTYRRALNLSRLPGPLRRLIWWVGLNVLGPARAHYLGTFGLTATAALGASGLNAPCPLTTTLHYGPFDAQGALDVRLAFDHRVLDGAMVARLLRALEDILRGAILAELKEIGHEPGLPALACA